ncbi:16S rRNA (cytosine(967)-C(5))-methyltransferase RsmB [Gimesia aquarii]|uniref:16S rRNA (cytosine(967)-C(5))-methyltransferase n=1 Tax=Gimesia aquarii TaxID=2527964 RepID=A0A517WQP5_9PLAN|nr:16S rRNA (cytosine(967)-C(5))-methyltransferase RsmB [Gimesia aquarii]QDU07586.1 Ribosomal RNA small subunit methyltransferase B [Gimesia aquarii]
MWSVIVKKKNVWHQKKPSSNSQDIQLPQYFRSARELAFFLLEEYRTRDQFVSDSLHRWDHRIELSSQDRRLAMEISIGVIRRQLTLDTLIEHQLTRPREKVEPSLWTLLQIGVYQLVMLDQIPDHAAVSETVELAGKLKRVRWKKMVNAILRSMSRQLIEEIAITPQANAIPLSYERYRCFASDYFDDPETNFSRYVSRAFSFPETLVSDWFTRYGVDQTLQIAQWFNQRNKLYLRVNLLKTNRESLLAELLDSGIQASLGKEPQSIRLDQAVPLESLVGFDSGKFTIQDESAIAAGNLLNPQPDETVLDLCAAPGTKTTHLAELMQNQGAIIATDVGEDRLDNIKQNTSRLGLNIVQPRLIKLYETDLPGAPFDAILVDAPCSNSGVLGKRPEARWRIDDSSINELVEIQRHLVRLALDHLKSRGRLVYSTCSFDPRENEELLKSVLNDYPGRAIVQENIHLPGSPSDGGYQGLVH